jgi:hypothetical protein
LAAHQDGKPNAEEVTIERINELADVCDKFRKLTGRWPTNIAFLVAVVPMRDTNVCFDAWGQPIVILSYTNSPGTIWLKSYGADGNSGHGSVVEELR